MRIKVTFVSNYLTIHQISLCREFYNKLGSDFAFVSSFEPSGDKLKYSNYESEPFVICSYLSKNERKRAKRTIDESDVVIFGSGDRSLLVNRKKLIFFYSEHLSKTKVSLLRKIHLKALYGKFTNAYLLCASSYSQIDFNSIGLFIDKCFRFGYFPQLLDCNVKAKDSNSLNLLWVGRELGWKHPEYAFFAAEVLFQNNYQFHVTVVSTHDGIIKEMATKYENEPWFQYIDFVSQTDNLCIQKLMYSSDIFIFSSDKSEGWGAVLNEAMNAGCCPIASSLAGSTLSLIDNGKNGFVFCGKDDFKEKLLESISDDTFINMGAEASNTIRAKWNATNAVSNLLKVFELIILNKDIPSSLINNGPGTKII